MAEPIEFIITNAGLDALVDAQNGETDAIQVTQVGLTESVFDAAPTLVALPGETKRIDSFGGQSVAPNVIHMTAQDTTTDTYDLRGIALFLADGTLFASYGQADPIFRKVSVANFLLAFDVRFSADVADDIVFGDAAFLYPPASETVKGVAELATQDETDAGQDDSRIVTPLKLEARLGPVIQAIADEAETRAAGDTALGVRIDDEETARAAAIAAEATARDNAIAALAQVSADDDAALQTLIDGIRALTITGGGLVDGGGALTASRVLSVGKATGPEVKAGARDDVAVTPLGLADYIGVTEDNGELVITFGAVTLQVFTGTVGLQQAATFQLPQPFPFNCLGAFVDGGLQLSGANYGGPHVSQRNQTEVTVYNPNPEPIFCTIMAIGL